MSKLVVVWALLESRYALDFNASWNGTINDGWAIQCEITEMMR
jgi:hypothetical protein